MLWMHFCLTLMIVVLSFFTLIRLMYNFLKNHTKSDAYLLFTFTSLGMFSFYDFCVLIFTFLQNYLPHIFRAQNYVIQKGTFYFSLLGLVGALLIMDRFMIWVLQRGMKTFQYKKGFIVLFLFLMLGLGLLIYYSIELVEINSPSIFPNNSVQYSYPFYIINSPRLLILCLLFIFLGMLLMIFTSVMKYFQFLKKTTHFPLKNTYHDYRTALLINIAITLNIYGIILRFLFAGNWIRIIFCDLLIVLAILIEINLSYKSGFGESLLCLLEIQALYVCHSSGKLVYSRYLDPTSRFNDEFIGAVLIIMNQITNEIRIDQTFVDQFVLQDNSQIVMDFGPNFTCILISSTYNPLFKKKLSQFSSIVEDRLGDQFSHWLGEKLPIQSKIDSYVHDVF